MPHIQALNDLRKDAAERYRPKRVRLLLVAETPPIARPPDAARYFYFEDIRKHDGLFRDVVRAVLKAEPHRASKASELSQLCERGVFLIDLKSDPTDPRPLSAFIPSLLERCRQLGPEHIILIKANVFDAAFAPLRAAGFPVAEVRVQFPGSGRQKEFAARFAEALSRSGFTW